MWRCLWEEQMGTEADLTGGGRWRMGQIQESVES